jgi:hypothetical protein
MLRRKKEENKKFFRNLIAACAATLAVLMLIGAGGGETPIPNLRMEGTARVVNHSYLQAEPQALLKGVARAPRYAQFFIPIGLQNGSGGGGGGGGAQTFTAFSLWLQGTMAPITGYSQSYGVYSSPQHVKNEDSYSLKMSDGRLTAPRSGIYTISVGANSAAANRCLFLVKNQYMSSSDTTGLSAAQNNILASNGDDTGRGASLHWTGWLNAGEWVCLGATSATTTPNFTGTQIFFAQLADFSTGGGSGSSNNTWTDFELKGSVNNFEGNSDNALVYFYGSAGEVGGTVTHPAIGTTLAVYYTDDMGGTDHAAARKWRAKDASKSLYEQRENDNSTIVGVVVVVPIDDAVINPHNPNLTFVYQRLNPMEMEEKWMPIAPVWTVVAPFGESPPPFKKY